MTRPFVVEVGNLIRNPGTRLRVERSGHLPGLSVLGVSVPPDAEVSVDVTIEGMDDRSLVANGRVSTRWTAECSRCLRPISGTVTAEVRELFEDPARGAPEGDGSAVGDEDIYPLHGEQVDLEPLARDAVLLALPPAPLCAEDCAGLCPVCGSDRNEADCGCDTTVRDERWAALDVLKDS
jgi:uncharacterized protein